MPIILRHFFKTNFLGRAIDCSLHLSSLIAVTIAHTDVVLPTLGQILQLMAQRTIGIGLCLHIAQTSKVLIVLRPPTRIGQFVINILTVHIFGLDNNRTSVWLWLFGQFKFLCRQHIGQTVSGSTLTIDLYDDGAHVSNGQRKGLGFGIILFTGNIIVMPGKATDCRLGIRTGRLHCHTGNRDYVILHSGTVATVVVEIEVDMVGILANDAAGELAILQLQGVAGIIL